jgi:hypothetical protein
MSFKINYTDRDTGKPAVKTFTGSRHNANGWADQMKQENGGQVSLVETAYNAPDKHISTVGDHTDKPTRPKPTDPGGGW